MVNSTNLTCFCVFLKYVIKNRPSAPRYMGFCLAFLCPNLIFFRKSIFNIKPWEFVPEVRARFSFIAGMFSPFFSTVLHKGTMFSQAKRSQCHQNSCTYLDDHCLSILIREDAIESHFGRP